MNRIERAFKNGKAFIPFITAGDPSLEITEELVFGLAEAGADIIELGVPFSDPVCEGTVIQRADERALSAGFTTDRLFDTVVKIRKKTDIPLILMTYINPVFVYGTEKYMGRCRDTGIDGIIVPDMPFDEKDEIWAECKRHGVTLISMVAPTSNHRVQKIARESEGFLYCVSSLGVTGVRSEITTDLAKMIRIAKDVTNTPCAVGFGISTPEQAKEMISQKCDGVIVGSAIVKFAEKYGDKCVAPIVEYVRGMKSAIM